MLATRSSRLLVLTLICVFSIGHAFGQTPISSATFSNTTATEDAIVRVTSAPDASGDVSASTEYDIYFGQANNEFITEYMINPGGGDLSYFNFVAPDTLVIRRVDNGRQLIIFYEIPPVDGDQIDTSFDPDRIFIYPDRIENEEAIYQTGYSNVGYDNILVNSSTNFANVERIDIIYKSGVLTSTPDNAVFPLVDRGGNDDVRVAAIKTLDSNGDPSDYYANVIRVRDNDGDWGRLDASGGADELYSLVMRRQDLTSEPIPQVDLGQQFLHGSAISFTEFGIGANEIVYGYSIFADDVTATGTDLVDFTNETNYPRSTSSSGLDLIAGVSTAVANDNNLRRAVGPGGYKNALNTWFKANELDTVGVTTSNNNSVTEWEDQWEGDHDAVSLGTSPTLLDGSGSGLEDINFNATVDFVDGVDRGLQIPNNTDFNTGGPYDTKGINLAFRTGNDISTKQQLYEQGDQDRGLNVYISGGSLYLGAWNDPSSGGWGFSDVSTSSISTETEYIITLEFDGGTGNLTGYLNGEQFGTVSGLDQLLSNTTTPEEIGLGNINNESRYNDGVGAAASFYGSISEFIYCNAPPSFSTAQRKQIESYLAIKYGITLDQSTPITYVNSAGTIIFDTGISSSIGGFLEYNNDIAGIGRDDDSALLQLQSQSENDNSLVRISRNSSIGTNDTWLIWGNDAGALTETTLNVPDSVENRLTRIWRASEVNEVGVTDVSFDITDLGYGTEPRTFGLLIAGSETSGDFSNAQIITDGTTSTIDGRTFLTFSNVNLNHQEYFTLSTEFTSCGPGGVTGDQTLWLQANSGTKNNSANTSSGDVDEWTNTVVNPGLPNVTTRVTRSEPTLTANGLNFNPMLSFNGTDDQLNQDDFQASVLFDAADNTIFFAFKRFTQVSTEVIAGWQANSSSIRAAYFENNGNNLRSDLFASPNLDSRDILDELVIATVTSETGQLRELFINGNSEDTEANETLDTSLDGDFALGSGPNDNFFTQSDMGEMIIFKKALTPAERNRVESYLAIKYGITLDQTSATDYTAADGGIIWEASTNTGYDNDIAGIGRDDDSCLLQLQSKSENSNSIVSIGLGTIAADNASNPNTFANNDAFLIWGNDGASSNSADVVAYTEGTITQRMQTIWRVDENASTVGDTQISFDLTGLGYTGSLSDYQLIISSNSSLTSPTIIPANTFSSNVVTFSGIDFADGDYFTLGTARELCGPGGITTNLSFWIRADLEVFTDAGTTPANDGESVRQWNDQSANSGNLDDPDTRTTFETGEANFNPVISFADDATSLEGSFTTTLAGLDIFLTGNYNSASGSDKAFFEFGSGGRRHFFINRRYASNNIFSPTINEDSYNLWTINHPSGTTADIFQNSEAFASSYNAASANASAGSFSVDLGDDASGGNRLTGTIGDLIAFQGGGLTATEIQQVETYMAIKYGITLDQTTPTNYLFSDGSTVLWNATDNSSYNQDIAGIGRDDASCHSQKQSRSVNSDDILIVGLGTVAATNEANTNNFDDNGDYLVWGNDGGSTAAASTNMADIPAELSERMARVWRFEDIGTVGNTEIEFDLTGTGFGTSNPDNYRLMIAGSGSGGTMSGATLVTGGTFNGSVLSFADVNLADGEYITLGVTAICGPGGVNTNLELWLKADVQVFSDAGSTLATNGSDVEQWNDQGLAGRTGSENDLGGGTPVEPIYRTNEVNFNPSVLFTDPNTSNASYISTNGGSDFSGDVTMISVFKTAQSQGTLNDFDDTPTLVGVRNAEDDVYGLGVYQGQVVFNGTVNDDHNLTSPLTYNNGDFYIASATRLQSTGELNLFIDSDNVATSVTGDNGALSTPTSFGIGNGSTGTTAGQFQGEISETIVFSSVLTANERTRVESYLALKYGLTRSIADGDDGGTAFDERDYRSSDETVIWDYDTRGATFYNDIAGIGKDDGSCFEQLHSKSENSDAIVDISTSSFSNDQSFFIWGNDNADVEAIDNNERPATINSRLNREWQAQETGTVGTVSVTFDLSAITGTPTGDNDLSQVRLMRSVDSDFSSGVTLTSPSSFNNSTKTVTFNVDYEEATGFYFTLGSLENDALPVELLSFTATALENEVLLRWATASESNNSHFSVERSTNAEVFESIGLVQGAGNSSELLLYQFSDDRPYSGNNFYRIRQVDFSGTYDFSEIVRVPFEQKEDLNLNLYPNPVGSNQILRIEVSGINEVMGTLTLYNSKGQLMLEKQVSANTQTLDWQLPSLPKGVYFIKLFNGSNKSTTKRLLIR